MQIQILSSVQSVSFLVLENIVVHRIGRAIPGPKSVSRTGIRAPQAFVECRTLVPTKRQVQYRNRQVFVTVLDSCL